MRLASDDDVTGPSLRCFYGAVGKVGRWGFLRSWRRRWCDGLGTSYGAGDGVTASEAAAAWCCGTSSWRDHLLDGSPLPPGAWQGRLRGPVCRRKRISAPASPSTRVYTVGPGKNRPGPRDLLPVRLSSLLLLRLGCRARRRRGGGGCRCPGCGGVYDGVLHAYSNGGGGFDL